MPGGCSLIRGAMIGTYTLTSPGSLVLIVAQVLAALKLPERHSFCLELPPLALRREAGGRSRVESLDLVPPNVGINLQRDPCRAAARCRHELPLAVGGEIPEVLLELVRSQRTRAVFDVELTDRLGDRRLQGNAAVLVRNDVIFPPPRFRPGRRSSRQASWR